LAVHLQPQVIFEIFLPIPKFVLVLEIQSLTQVNFNIRETYSVVYYDFFRLVFPLFEAYYQWYIYSFGWRYGTRGDTGGALIFWGSTRKGQLPVVFQNNHCDAFTDRQSVLIRKRIN